MSATTKVTVAPCLPTDAQSVEDLFIAYRHFYGCQNDEKQAAAFLRARIAEGESRVFTAKASGQVVGFCQVYNEFSSLRLTVTWVLNDLFVASDARGLGAGRELVLHTLREGRREGAAAVVLETKHDNTTARKLYQSLGFVESHEEGDFIHYRHDLGGVDNV